MGWPTEWCVPPSFLLPWGLIWEPSGPAQLGVLAGGGAGAEKTVYSENLSLVAFSWQENKWLREEL